MSTVVVAQMTLELWGGLFCILGAVIVSMLNKPRRRSATCLSLMLLDNTMVLLANTLAYYYRGNVSAFGDFVVKASNTVDFLFELGLVFLFGMFLYQMILENGGQVKKAYLLTFDALLVFSMLLLFINCFNGWVFSFDDNNFYYRNTGWYFFMGLMVLEGSLLLLAIFVYRKYFSRLMWFSLWGYVLVPFLMVILQIFFYGLSLVSVGVTISMFLMIIGFEREKADELLWQSEAIELSNSRILLGQIKPHFIQNCLSSIRGLCYENADKAADLVSNLSGYLRDTFVFMEKDELISFEQEMELVDFYLNIEQERFPNLITVHKDIEIRGFLIPPLTIQPMVENAIRHGIRKKQQNGNLYIRTYQESEMVYVEIRDDGAGFVNSLIKDKDAHVGIRNVTRRLEIMSQGSLNVESIIGQGTTVRISIPTERCFRS